MADQHNPNIPALGNNIADDVVDIKENLEFHKDCFEAICSGWSNSSAASLAVDNLAADSVVTADILADNITGAEIVDDAIDSEHIADGAVDPAHLAANAVETAKILDANVTQAKLKTSMSAVSHTGNTTYTHKTLPGGTYGFHPQVRVSSAASGYCVAMYDINPQTTNTTYATNVVLRVGDAGYTVYAQQRYVTSSGEVFWIFILRDKATKKIFSVCHAPDHPCFGNGGKPQLVPHPFPDFNESTQEIIVINPSKEEVIELKRRTVVDSETEPDRDLIDVILEDCHLDETTEPDWPTKEVTVGLSPEWEEKAIGESIAPIKKIIPKPAYIKTAALKIKIIPKEM